jgi:addiction module RelB/DinJ family antitoxin
MAKRGLNKTAMLTARIDPDIQREAVKILRELGLNKAEAITLFFSQVKLHRGLPFEVNLPKEAEQIPAQKSVGNQDEV